MTLKETFVCPKCGNGRINMLNTGVLLEDTRLDHFKCLECETQWRVYSKVCDVSSEIIFVTPEADEKETPAETEVK